MITQLYSLRSKAVSLPASGFFTRRRLQPFDADPRDALLSPLELGDAVRSIRLVRAQAIRIRHQASDRLGVMGFSLADIWLQPWVRTSITEMQRIPT